MEFHTGEEGMKDFRLKLSGHLESGGRNCMDFRKISRYSNHMLFGEWLRTIDYSLSSNPTIPPPCCNTPSESVL